MNEHNSRSVNSKLPHEEVALQWQSGDVVEVPLLLSAGQMMALEEAAHDRGLTAGEMVRRLLEEFIGPAALDKRSFTTKIATC